MRSCGPRLAYWSWGFPSVAQSRNKHLRWWFRFPWRTRSGTMKELTTKDTKLHEGRKPIRCRLAAIFNTYQIQPARRSGRTGCRAASLFENPDDVVRPQRTFSDEKECTDK